VQRIENGKPGGAKPHSRNLRKTPLPDIPECTALEMHLHYGIYVYTINGGYQLRLSQEREKMYSCGASRLNWRWNLPGTARS